MSDDGDVLFAVHKIADLPIPGGCVATKLSTMYSGSPAVVSLPLTQAFWMCSCHQCLGLSWRGTFIAERGASYGLHPKSKREPLPNLTIPLKSTFSLQGQMNQQAVLIRSSWGGQKNLLAILRIWCVCWTASSVSAPSLGRIVLLLISLVHCFLVSSPNNFQDYKLWEHERHLCLWSKTQKLRPRATSSSLDHRHFDSPVPESVNW